MNWNRVNWKLVDQLRERFLSQAPGSNYWQSTEELENYDLTFGARIGWKWDGVLKEVQAQGWIPGKEMDLLDWGCGTGVATRRFVSFWGTEAVRRVYFWDHSSLAVDFALQKMSEVSSQRWDNKIPKNPFILLVSHVLMELESDAYLSLLNLADQARAVFWVEPGSYEVSRKLIEVHERLLEHFTPIAPCPHSITCGLLAESLKHHWCHHFIKSPAEAFQSKNWSLFSRRMGIDLRSLPTSYLAMSKELSQAQKTTRMLGKPRFYKGYCTYLGCEKSGEITEHKVRKRENPECFKELKKLR